MFLVSPPVISPSDCTNGVTTTLPGLDGEVDAPPQCLSFWNIDASKEYDAKRVKVTLERIDSAVGYDEPLFYIYFINPKTNEKQQDGMKASDMHLHNKGKSMSFTSEKGMTIAKITYIPAQTAFDGSKTAQLTFTFETLYS